MFIGALILIGSIEKRFKCIDNQTYNWIQDDGTHYFIRRRIEPHYRDQNFKYSMLTSYGALDDQGLHVHSPHGLTTRHILSHKEKDKSIESLFMNLFRH